MKRSHTDFSDENLLEGCAMACPEVRDSNPAGMKVRNRVSKFCGLTLMACALMLSGGLTSCHHHDDREPVLPPVVENAPNTLAGVITDIAGTPVAGATVTLGTVSATTDSKGAYVISDVAQGSYEVTATADGMYPASATVNFTQSEKQNLLWSVALNKKVSENLVITDSDSDASGDVNSGNIPNNEEGSVTITVNVPANTVPENTTITISPIYSQSDARGVRAETSETMLIGATVSCSDASVTLNTPIDVVFSLDSSVVGAVTAKEYDVDTNTWHDVTPQIDEDGTVIIKTTKFTSFGIFLPVVVTTTITSQEIEFAQSLFDNRKGNKAITVDNASFFYKAGTSVNANAQNKLEGLLIEYLARMFGATVSDMTGSYPLNATLEVGQGLLLDGTQAVNSVTVASGSTSVTGTHYGNVTVNVHTFSVDHNGGIVEE